MLTSTLLNSSNCYIHVMYVRSVLYARKRKSSMNTAIGSGSNIFEHVHCLCVLRCPALGGGGGGGGI